MTNKLLPCPFCGHDDQLYPAHHFPGTGPAYAIDCLRCGIDFTPREGMDVVAAWNRRASQAEIERLNENLRNQRAWVLHWQEDVAAGLKPSTGSLAKALENLDAALGSKE